MMKKILDILFVMMFGLCLVLPGIFMEFGKNVKSQIDNEYLPELKIQSFKDLDPMLTTYIDKRIGFRNDALSLYQWINDLAFSVMEHPTYMYGENGHVYFKDISFIKNYQHLNLNEEYANEFSEALLGFQNYTQKKGKLFMYFYIPDKETVYPEFYPKSINVYGNISRTDQILNALKSKGVKYYFAKDAMVEAKKNYLVNNVKYDAGHWNHHGAFVSIRSLYQQLQEIYPQIELIESEEYNIEKVLMESLQVSHFKINEEVPIYFLKESNAINKTEDLKKNILISHPDQYVSHYVNTECESKPKLLIFGDSYLAEYDQFFINHFSEYTYIHRYNVYNQEYFEYYVNKLNPDIVIFENPERSHIIDLYQPNTIDLIN